MIPLLSRGISPQILHHIQYPAFAKLFSKSLCCCRVQSLFDLLQFAGSKEQIAPFPYDRIIKALSYYPNASWHKHLSMQDLRLVQMLDLVPTWFCQW